MNISKLNGNRPEGFFTSCFKFKTTQEFFDSETHFQESFDFSSAVVSLEL
jgi:hypothetical protein